MFTARKWIVFSLLFITLPASSRVAADGFVDEGTVLVISAEDLYKTLGKVFVIDTRSKKDFRSGHVPGSRHMDWKEWTAARKSTKVAEPTGELEDRLREFGLSNDHFVVIVGKPGSGDEARVAWNLLYWGSNRVVILDGGFPAWKVGINPIERGEPKPMVRGKFMVLPRDNRRAKSAEGALSLPASRFYRTDGHFIGRDDLEGLAAPDVTDSPLLAMLIEARLGRMLKVYDGN